MGRNNALSQRRSGPHSPTDPNGRAIGLGAETGRPGAPVAQGAVRTYMQPAGPAFSRRLYFVGMNYCFAFRSTDSSLLVPALHPFRSVLQVANGAPAGWGLGYYQGGQPLLRKQPKADIVEFEEHQAWDSGEQERIGMAMDLESALRELGAEDRTIVWLHDVEC